MLPPEALARGLGPLGSCAAVHRFAQKLVAGQPALVVVLGGSVSFGAGASWWGSNYPTLLADWCGPGQRSRGRGGGGGGGGAQP